MTYFFKTSFCLLVIFVHGLGAKGQTKALVYIGHINNPEEVKSIPNPSNGPLLVLGGSVYSLDSNCFTDSFAGVKKIKNTALDNSKNGRRIKGDRGMRQLGSENEESNDKRQRHSGGGMNESKSTAQIRNSGGGGANANDSPNSRHSGGGMTISFHCEQRGNGVILYLRPLVNNEVVKVYYMDSFIDAKYYQIKSADE